MELDEGRCENSGDQAGSGADREPAALHPAQSTSLRSGCLYVGHDAAKEREECLTVGGEAHHCLSRAAIEQEHPELALDKPDLAAQRGLRQVEPGRGACEALLVGHRKDIFELAQLHAIEPIAIDSIPFMSLISQRRMFKVIDTATGAPLSRDDCAGLPA